MSYSNLDLMKGNYNEIKKSINYELTSKTNFIYSVGLLQVVFHV